MYTYCKLLSDVFNGLTDIAIVADHSWRPKIFCRFYSILPPLLVPSADHIIPNQLLLKITRKHKKVYKWFFQKFYATSGHDSNLADPPESHHEVCAWNDMLGGRLEMTDFTHGYIHASGPMYKTYLSKVNLQSSRRICRHLQVIWTNSSVVSILMFIQFNPANIRHLTHTLHDVQWWALVN